MSETKIATSPFATLIIAVYKNIAFLELVLLSIERQTFKNFEVIVAEDDANEDMKLFLDACHNRFSFPIKHISQEDNGFRKNKILNKAILLSKGEYIQFIDGDSLLHPDYIKEFVNSAKEGYCLYGRRVYLDEKLTNGLIQSKNVSKLTLFKILFSRSLKKKHAWYLPVAGIFQKNKPGIWGCSMGLMKSDLFKVNGFDEDYVRIGVGEDHDLEWRLIKAGIRIKSLKYIALQYHLWHPEVGRNDDVEKNHEMMKNKIKKGEFFLPCRTNNETVKLQNNNKI